MENVYDTGDRVTLYMTTPFQDADGTVFDPPVVNVKVTPPSGTTVTYVYGVDDEVTRNDTGDYECSFDVDSAEWWHYRIEGETVAGENRGADEGSFYVIASQI